MRYKNQLTRRIGYPAPKATAPSPPMITGWNLFNLINSIGNSAIRVKEAISSSSTALHFIPTKSPPTKYLALALMRINDTELSFQLISFAS